MNCNRKNVRTESHSLETKLPESSYMTVKPAVPSLMDLKLATQIIRWAAADTNNKAAKIIQEDFEYKLLPLLQVVVKSLHNTTGKIRRRSAGLRASTKEEV